MPIRKRNATTLRDRARSMRTTPTDAEYKLWYYLRAQQVNGVKFRRQTPIGRYIVDFVTFAANLIVELDGEQHAEQREYDDQRTRWLEAQGFRVLRFWNCEVLEDPESVVMVIANTVAEIMDREA